MKEYGQILKIKMSEMWNDGHGYNNVGIDMK